MPVAILDIWNISANRTEKKKKPSRNLELYGRQNKYIDYVECETIINAVEKIE